MKSQFSSLILSSLILFVCYSFSLNTKAFTEEWYVLQPTEYIPPGAFAQSGISTMPINQISRYRVSDINSAQAERYTVSEAAPLCESTFNEYICAIQLNNADVNSDDQLSFTELNSALMLVSYVSPAGVMFKD